MVDVIEVVQLAELVEVVRGRRNVREAAALGLVRAIGEKLESIELDLGRPDHLDGTMRRSDGDRHRLGQSLVPKRLLQVLPRLPVRDHVRVRLDLVDLINANKKKTCPH